MQPRSWEQTSASRPLRSPTGFAGKPLPPSGRFVFCQRLADTNDRTKPELRAAAVFSCSRVSFRFTKICAALGMPIMTYLAELQPPCPQLLPRYAPFCLPMEVLSAQPNISAMQERCNRTDHKNGGHSTFSTPLTARRIGAIHADQCACFLYRFYSFSSFQQQMVYAFSKFPVSN